MIKNIFIIIQAVIKSIWNATTKTVWGIAGIYLLAGLIKGMDIDASRITSLLDICIFMIKYWIVFWITFLISNIYFELKWEIKD